MDLGKLDRQKSVCEPDASAPLPGIKTLPQCVVREAKANFPFLAPHNAFINTEVTTSDNYRIEFRANEVDRPFRPALPFGGTGKRLGEYGHPCVNSWRA